MDSQTSKVAVITGANTGLGFTLAQRLLNIYPKIQLCLACRNKDKGLAAASSLTETYPCANISVVTLDTSSVTSVYSAAESIKVKYDHIDYLYLNAGAMKVTGVDWQYFWKGLFSSRIFYMFTTGEGLLCQTDELTEDGLQCVFQTNVFGHYVLVKELEDRLGSTSGKVDQPSQIIWTSSNASQEKMFDINDFQHKNGKDPYGASKYAIDVLSVGLNEKMNKKFYVVEFYDGLATSKWAPLTDNFVGPLQLFYLLRNLYYSPSCILATNIFRVSPPLSIYSYPVCPGLVMTNMTYGILPQWFWLLCLPFMWLLRFFVPIMTNTTQNGTEALVWLSYQDPLTLDPQTKYMSHVSVFNRPYIAKDKMNINPDTAEKFIKELDKLDYNLKMKYKK